MEKFLIELGDRPAIHLHGVSIDASIDGGIRATTNKSLAFDLYDLPDPKDPFQSLSAKNKGTYTECIDHIRALATNQPTRFTTPIALSILPTNVAQHFVSGLSGARQVVNPTRFPSGDQVMLTLQATPAIKAKFARKGEGIQMILNGDYARLRAPQKKTIPVYSIARSEDERILRNGDSVLLIWANIEPHRTELQSTPDITRPETLFAPPEKPPGSTISFLLLIPTSTEP